MCMCHSQDPWWTKEGDPMTLGFDVDGSMQYDSLLQHWIAGTVHQ